MRLPPPDITMPFLGYVRDQLRRCALEHQVYGLEYVAHGLEQDLGKLAGANLDGLGQAGDQVTALDLLDAHVRPRHDAAYAHLDLFRSLFAHKHVVTAADVADYCLVEGGARRFDALALCHPAERDDSALGSASTHVDYHLAVRLRDVEAPRRRPWRRRSPRDRPSARRPRSPRRPRRAPPRR